MSRRDLSAGIMLVISATVCVALGWGGVKLLGARLPVPEIVFFRALAGLIVLAPLTYLRTGSLNGNNKKLLIARGVFGFIGMLLAFYAMTKISLGDAAMLLNTFPLFIALLAPFFLKESSSPWIFLLIAVAFIGVAFILKPTPAIFNGVAFAGLASGVSVAFAMMIIRKLHETDNTWIIATWFTAVIMIGAAPLMLLDFVLPTTAELVIIVFTGTILTASQLLTTKAYKYAEASILAPFSYLAVMWSYGLDIAIWSHLPDVWSLVGSIIVIGSGIGIIELAKRPIVRPGATS